MPRLVGVSIKVKGTTWLNKDDQKYMFFTKEASNKLKKIAHGFRVQRFKVSIGSESPFWRHIY